MKPLGALKEQTFTSIEELAQEAYDLNYDLADHPEISGKEFYACEQMCRILENHGIPVERSFAGIPTAFCGQVRMDPDSKVKIGILAEYDALAEIGHGCGHCASGSLSLLAALALHANEKDLYGNIHIIGTPDEELTGKKIDMAQAGIFDDYSFVIMIHMDMENRVKMEFMALTAFYYKFKGRPAHASAAPWEGRNALNGAMLMIHAFDMMRQHIKPDARIHGIITKGGAAPNIIPDYVVTDYTLRYPDSRYLSQLEKMAHDCAKGAAMATQTEVEIDHYAPTLDSLKPNPAGEQILEEVYEELGIDLATGESENKGSSDIGNVSWRCPAFHPTLSIGDTSLTHHTRQFAAKMKEKEVIEPVITRGAQVISLMILKVLTQPDILESIQIDFNKE
ncbi:MAG: M20 family metallopeptidase [Clostridiales Family XIII bacterium]|nr:M20 family metallopeptidase [Clostridia bacterium]MDY3011584.1 M20 family metallopeptidase [Clostridiales Family XIII bacterium]